MNTAKERIKQADLDTTLKQGEEYVQGVMADAQHKIKQGQEQVQHLISEADKKLRENPWPIIAGVAAVSVLAGMIIGGRKR